MYVTTIHETDTAEVDCTELTDEEIIARVCRGDGRAMFELIVQRHGRRLHRMVCSIVRNSVEAEDIVQETFARALAMLPQYSGSGRFVGWLTRIASHEALGRKRQQKRICVEHWESDDSEIAHAALDAARSGADPESCYSNKQLGTLLQYAIARLPRHFRVVFQLRALEELSTLETARHLKIPPQTVKTRFHRAKVLLRAHLSGHLGEDRYAAGHTSRSARDTQARRDRGRMLAPVSIFATLGSAAMHRQSP
ncbi:MAG TPA: sigma-70 family RNA polymerase sigma factor [Haliangium sp.]|nr:sigma-70 family RNA polymerase sigma factor [Haliangium sp.]